MTVSGSHIKVMDLTNSPIAAGETLFSFVGNVQRYGGVNLFVASDVDLSIVFEWSVDGVVFVPDISRIITFDSAALAGEGIYERDVLGILCRIMITNTSLSNGSVTIQSYGKLRSTGNYDNGVSLDEPPPPPVQDVWWVRDTAGDPSQSTTLLGNSWSVVYGDNITEQNQPDPLLDYKRDVTLGSNGSVTLNWEGKSNGGGGGGSSAYRSLCLLGNGGQRCHMEGPGIRNCLIAANNGLRFLNDSTFQSDETNYTTIVSTANAIISNVRNSLFTGIEESSLEFADDGDTARNFVTGVRNATLNRGAGDGLIGMQDTVILRLDTDWQRSSLRKSLIFGTHIESSDDTVNGCVIITDNGGNVLSPLPLTGSNNAHHFHTRFDGGYSFWTNQDCTGGVGLTAGDTAWNVLCDERQKLNKQEYLEDEDILDRLVACKVYTYFDKCCYEKDSVKESACFRINATAQDVHSIFHPEHGDSDAVTAQQIEKATEQWIEDCVERQKRDLCDSMNRHHKKLHCSQDIEGNWIFPPPLDYRVSAEDEEAMVKIAIDQSTEPENVKSIEKHSLMFRKTDEYTASFHLAIKALKKQIDALQKRCDALEQQ